MNLLRINNGQLAFGHTPLLKDANISIESKERVCIVGRNGAGKSSLLKVLDGLQVMDDGVLNVNTGVTIARLEQDPPQSVSGNVYDYVATGLEHIGEVLKQYQQLSHDVEALAIPKNLDKLNQLTEEIEKNDGWAIDARIESICKRLNLDPAKPLSALSGGWLRKVALAKALVAEPDLLLLDEPTNHLDIDTIEWLEQFLMAFNGSLVFISHDRGFIDRMATRIIDLDRGVATSWPGSYQQYLEGKAKWLEDEAQHNALFDKKLAEEEVWIRQGIKARRTRNEGRVRALKALRQERAQRLTRQGSVNMSVNEGNRSGKLVFELKDVSFNYENKPIVANLTTTVMRGDKVALIGPNGCGKSTLIKLLLEQVAPHSGNVRSGMNLEVAYFDQYREQLNPEQTVAENVGEGKQQVMVNGRDRHILSYLQDFLFSPERARTPVKALSGGEKNRLLLARLFLRPANVIILDEPTNDLDVETLELLESLLADFEGTLLLVSHDRAFIDNTVTSSLWFAGDGVWQEHIGGYTDGISQGASFYKANQEATASVDKAGEKKSAPEKKTTPDLKPKKLSYKLQRELEGLPKEMELLEVQISQIQEQISAADFYSNDNQVVSETLAKLSELEETLEEKFMRWEELEQMQQGA